MTRPSGSSSSLIVAGVAGTAAAVAGTSLPIGHEISRVAPDGTYAMAGFVLNGVDAGDLSGFPATRAGDVNGDGIDDLIVGARYADPDGKTYAGESYVVFGRAAGFPATFELRRLFPSAGGDGSAGFVLMGIDPFDKSGRAVNGVGDINGDGIDDLIVGARYADPDGHSAAGESYVIFGRTSGFPAVIELASLFSQGGGDASMGFVLKGIDADDQSGRAISGLGDVNGDGIDDLIIGAYRADPDGHSYAGESYVVFGRVTGFPATLELRSLLPGAGGDGSDGFVVEGIDAADQSGNAVSAAGDVNGDGIDDFLVGARYADANGQANAGESYVIFGRATGFPAAFELRGLLPQAGGDGSAGFVLRGIDADDQSGRAVSRAGDVNDDGIDDLIIGAYGADPDGRQFAGESYVVYGRTTGFPPSFELRSLLPQAGGDGSAGFVLSGIDVQDRSGISVSDAGDLNADGIADLAIGAWFADPGGRSAAGESYVVYGRATGFPAVFDLSRLLPD